MDKKLAILFVALIALIVLSSGCVKPPVCGNGVCEPGEPNTCPADCGIQPKEYGYLEVNVFNEKTGEQVPFGEVVACPVKELEPYELRACLVTPFEKGYAKIRLEVGEYEAYLTAPGYERGATQRFGIFSGEITGMYGGMVPTTTGAVSVTVKDNYNNPIVGAFVKITNEETGWTEEGYTSPEKCVEPPVVETGKTKDDFPKPSSVPGICTEGGTVSFYSVPEGSYTVEAKKEGYLGTYLKNQMVYAGKQTTVQVTLSGVILEPVGDIEATVTACGTENPVEGAEVTLSHSESNNYYAVVGVMGYVGDAPKVELTLYKEDGTSVDSVYSPVGPVVFYDSTGNEVLSTRLEVTEINPTKNYVIILVGENSIALAYQEGDKITGLKGKTGFGWTIGTWTDEMGMAKFYNQKYGFYTLSATKEGYTKVTDGVELNVPLLEKTYSICTAVE